MRILIVTWDGGGNVPPALGLARRLKRRGHTVTILGQDSQRGDVEATGCAFRPIDGVPAWATPHGRWHPDQIAIMAALCVGPAVNDSVDHELRTQPVDVAVVDCMMLGALTVAESHHLPTAALFHLLYQPTQVEGSWFAMWEAALPLINDLRTSRNLKPLTEVRRVWDSLDRVLVATPRELDLDLDRAVPDNVRYVGPILDDTSRPWPSDLPWAPNDSTPLVLVSFSTNDYNHLSQLQRTVDAVAALPVNTLVTTGPAIAPDAITAPTNVAVRSWIPHAAVLPHTAAVVTHAGHATVTTALAYGVPLVCVPTAGDQLFTAQRVEAIGAGRCLASDAPAETIRDATRDVTESTTYRHVARSIQATIDRLDRAAAAVTEIEALATP